MKKIFDIPHIGIAHFSDEVAASGSSPTTKAVQSVKSQLDQKKTNLSINEVSGMITFK